MVTLVPTGPLLGVRLVMAGAGGAFTTCVRAAEVLAFSPAAPPYTAVMAWLPWARALVLNVAAPLLIVPVPSVVLPSRNVTVPVGVVLPLVLLTAAVNVTLCPNTEGFTELLTVVLVLALVTVNVPLLLLTP
jgi:hypothetical protein